MTGNEVKSKSTSDLHSRSKIPLTTWSVRLREELANKAAAYAQNHALPHFQTRSGVVLLPHDVNRTIAGNIEPESFDAICQTASWRARLTKAHTSRKTFPSPYNESACEVDSCMSSDALLMSIFCHPGAIDGELARLMGVAPQTTPEFGVAGSVSLLGGRLDSTEVDMRIGDTHVESKLTETSFTTQTAEVVRRYAGLDDVFDASELPRDENDRFVSYQLIRNVLAIANHSTRRFLVLFDSRRPDLLHEWWTIFGTIRDAALRRRCGFVLWQELAASAPPSLGEFLRSRYGFM